MKLFFFINNYLQYSNGTIWVGSVQQAWHHSGGVSRTLTINEGLLKSPTFFNKIPFKHLLLKTKQVSCNSQALSELYFALLYIIVL